MDETFDIYFNNLNEETQKEYLKFIEIDDPRDANLDLDIIPLCTFEKPEI